MQEKMLNIRNAVQTALQNRIEQERMATCDFDDIMISPRIQRAVAEIGMVKLSELQVKLTIIFFSFFKRNMLSVNLANDSNTIVYDIPGVGKTTAMVISMLSHCNEHLNETQVLSFAPTYESVKEIASMTAEMSK